MKKLISLMLGYFMSFSLHAGTILVFGDSLSAAHGIDAEQGWVNLLRTKLKTENKDYRVVNSSVPGATTGDGLERLEKVLNQYKPQITILELGANDGLRGLPIISIRNNLQEMIDLAKKINSKILLVGLRLPPTYGLRYAKSFQQLFVDLARKNEIALVPLLLDKVDEDKELFQPDGLHPTADAQAVMLENVWNNLEDLMNEGGESTL